MCYNLLLSFARYCIDWFDSDEIHDGMNLELYYQWKLSLIVDKWQFLYLLICDNSGDEDDDDDDDDGQQSQVCCLSRQQLQCPAFLELYSTLPVSAWVGYSLSNWTRQIIPVIYFMPQWYLCKCSFVCIIASFCVLHISCLTLCKPSPTCSTLTVQQMHMCTATGLRGLGSEWLFYKSNSCLKPWL